MGPGDVPAGGHLSPERLGGGRRRPIRPVRAGMLRRLIAAVVLAGFSSCVFAAQKPLWELGLGVGALSFPDYPGSDQQRLYVVPLPYLVYRGKYLRAGRNGIQGRLFWGDRVHLYISLSASPPVNDSDNSARRGMPDLRPMVELGPGIDVRLWRSANARMHLDLRLPVRTAITIQFTPRQVGWLFTPTLSLGVSNVAGWSGSRLGVEAGPLFANRSYNQTFYGVPPAFATPARPAYSANGGYSGAQLTVSLSRRFSRYWIGAFVRYQNISGAVFADSPLVVQKQNVLFGVGATWVFGQSSRLVDTGD